MIVSHQKYNDKEFIFIYRNENLFMNVLGKGVNMSMMYADFVAEIIEHRNHYVAVVKDRSGHLDDQVEMPMKKFIKFAQISYEDWN